MSFSAFIFNKAVMKIKINFGILITYHVYVYSSISQDFWCFPNYLLPIQIVKKTVIAHPFWIAGIEKGMIFRVNKNLELFSITIIL